MLSVAGLTVAFVREKNMASFAELHGVKSAEQWAELRRRLSVQIAELVRRDCDSRETGKVECLAYHRHPHNRRSATLRDAA